MEMGIYCIHDECGRLYYGSWVARYISKALRNSPTGVNTLTVIDKEFDNDMMYTPVIGGDKDQYLGESYMEDW